VPSTRGASSSLQVVVHLADDKISILFKAILFQYRSILLDSTPIVLLFVEESEAGIGIRTKPAMGKGRCACGNTLCQRPGEDLSKSAWPNDWNVRGVDLPHPSPSPRRSRSSACTLLARAVLSQSTSSILAYVRASSVETVPPAISSSCAPLCRVTTAPTIFFHRGGYELLQLQDGRYRVIMGYVQLSNSSTCCSEGLSLQEGSS
jgi:hypothetical protein